MKGYIIICMALDSASCDDDGVFNSGGFGLVGSVVHKTKDEAKEILEQTMDTDMEDLKSTFLECEEDEGCADYVFAKEDGRSNERELNVYYKGDLINSTRYRIEEVEIQ